MSEILQVKQYVENKRFDEAKKLCDKLYQENPNDISIVYMMVVISFNQNNLTFADELSQRLIELDSKELSSYHLRLEVLSKDDNFQKILELCNLAISNNIRDIKIIEAKIKALLELKEFIQVLDELKDINQSISGEYKFQILNYQAEAYYGLKEFDKALEVLNQSLLINNTSAHVYDRKTKTYIMKQDIKKAIKSAEQAVQKKDAILMHIDTLANMYCIANKNKKAISMYKKQSKKLELLDTDNKFLLYYSFYLLKNKQFKEAHALKCYKKDAFHLDNGSTVNNLTTKKDIKDSIIMIKENEGIGDNIMYARFYQNLYDEGAKEVRLMKTIDRNIFGDLINGNKFIKMYEDGYYKDVDYYVNIPDLQSLFIQKIEDIPQNINILEHIPHSQLINTDDSKLNIGFVYRGNPEHVRDSLRSIHDLSVLEKLFSIPDTIFYSLQYDNNEEVSKYQEKYPNIIDTKPLINSMSDTLNIIRDLDLVITIDSSVAHLSATNETKTYLMLPTCNDHRWFIDDDKSPWYGCMSIFRQKNAFDWSNVINDIYKQLLKHEKLN